MTKYAIVLNLERTQYTSSQIEKILEILKKHGFKCQMGSLIALGEALFYSEETVDAVRCVLCATKLGEVLDDLSVNSIRMLRIEQDDNLRPVI